jgi:hypothetical protein
MRLHTRRDVLRQAGSAAMFAAIASQVDFTRPAFANDKKLTGRSTCSPGRATTTRN